MKHIRFHSVIMLVALFILAAVSIPWPAEADDAELLQKLARAGGLEKFPRANIIFVERQRQIRYEEDGTYVDRTYQLIKFLTEPAVTYLSTVPVLEYYSYRSEGKVLSACVIKSGGQITVVPAEMISDVTNPMYRDLNVKDDNMRLIQIAFKNLQVGDAVEYSVEERCVRPVTRNFELKEGKYLQEDEPLIYARIEINGPEKKPLNHVLKCADKLSVKYGFEKKGGRATYVWEASDVPAFATEPGWNTRQHFSARLLASTIGSWPEVSRMGYQISKPAMDDNEALRAVVAEITRGLKADDEKIDAILLFLRKSIRYKGLTSLSAYQSKPATQTLADRFGVCRDVAVLMCSMLDVAGIKSYPAATGYNRVFDHEIPHDIFQHMIVAVPDRKGSYRLYDPTSVLFAGDRLPGYAGGAPLLIWTPDGEELTRIPHVPAGANMGSIEAKSRIDAAGGLSSAVTITARGFYDEDLRNWRKRTKTEEYTKRWREILVQLHPAAKLTGLSTTDPEDLTVPFYINLSYEAPGYVTPGGPGAAVRMPAATDTFERVLGDIVAKANRPERKYPFIITTAAGVQMHETVTFPPGYAVKSVPESVSMRTKDLELAVRYTPVAPAAGTGDTRLEFNKTFLVDSRQFDPESYIELRKLLEANSNAGKAQVLLALSQ